MVLPRALDASGVHRKEHVARALVAFRAQPLNQRIGLGVDTVDLDAGQIGEVAVQRLVCVVVARRIEIEGATLGMRMPRDQQTNACRNTGCHKNASFHFNLPDASAYQCLSD